MDRFPTVDTTRRFLGTRRHRHERHVPHADVAQMTRGIAVRLSERSGEFDQLSGAIAVAPGPVP